MLEHLIEGLLQILDKYGPFVALVAVLVVFLAGLLVWLKQSTDRMYNGQLALNKTLSSLLEQQMAQSMIHAEAAKIQAAASEKIADETVKTNELLEKISCKATPCSALDLLRGKN